MECSLQQAQGPCHHYVLHPVILQASKKCVQSELKKTVTDGTCFANYKNENAPASFLGK
jgi:hypothetical protein